MRRTPHAPARLARRSLMRGVMVWLFAATVLVISAAHSPQWADAPEAARSAAQVLLDEHGCWTDVAPEGVEARHAVVTKGGVTRYVGMEMTTRAIEQELFGKSPAGLTVHGFCR